MAKDRLEETFAHLEKEARAGQLGSLNDRDVGEMRKHVARKDKIQGGATLSLDWSWYNKRPPDDERHAIRGYLLASIYNKDIRADQARTEATRVKSFGMTWLRREITARISDYLGLLDPLNTKSVVFQVGKKGGGNQRAQGVCDRRELSVEDEMETLALSDRAIAVVLIDMQASGDVGQYRLYGGKSVLAHQQAVLKSAADLHMIVYDIVIDPDDARKLDPRNRPVVDLDPEEKLELVKRQRRDSYAEAAKTKTISALRDLYAGGARVRHIPKPSHPSFIGTLFAEHLRADGIETVVVMGYDANQCIKATVFGAPGEERMQTDHNPTDKEVTALREKEKGLSLQQAVDRLTTKKKVVTPYTPGILDLEIDVLTSRAVMASSARPLEEEWGILAGLR
jgi:nicotinamidase-related amidase